MDEEEQLALLDYARFHGLASDHRVVPPLLSSLIPSPPRDFLLQLADPKEVPHLEQLAAFSTREKLFLDREAAALLSTCMWNVEHELTQEDLSFSAGQRRGKELRVELPMLRTDHELDMRIFGRQVVPGPLGDNIPLEEVNERNDEGISWPLESLDLPRQFNEKLRNEKLEVSKDAILYLQSIIRGEYCMGDEVVAIRGHSVHDRVPKLEPITPPLLPMPALAGPFFPSSSEGRLDLLSDRVSPTASDSRQLTEMLMDQDSLITTQKEMQNCECASSDLALDDLSEMLVQTPDQLGTFEGESSPPLRKHLPVSELMVEGPITPPSSTLPCGTKARVSVQEMLQEATGDAQQSERGESSEVEFEAFFNRTVKPMAEDVNMKLAQEQLQDTDSTLRVDVPPMDFSMNLAPWQTYRKSAGYLIGCGKDIPQQKRLIQDVNNVCERDQRWPGARRIDNDLKWAPFPVEFGKVALKEVIEGDENGSIEQYLANVDFTEDIDFDCLTWKPEGLQLLKDDDEELDEAELLQDPSYKEQDLNPLLRKRNLDVEISGHETSKRIKASTEKCTREQVQSHGSPHRGLPEVEGSLLSGGYSTVTSLETFMHLRGVSRKTKCLPLESKADQSIGQQSDAKEQPLCPDKVHSVEVPEYASRLPSTPEPNPPAGHRPFVISLALLAQRRLIRCIRRIYPDAVLIERDFTLQRMPTHGQLEGTSRTVVMDSIDEADLIVSPSIGVIWTTMQKIKQRPLPGQAQKPGFREKITRLSQRYERLIVLVSEGRISNGSTKAYENDSLPMAELNEKDSDALAELMSFAAVSNDEIAILFASGGEEELAKWIVALMVKYSIADQEVKLVQEESLWEVFLRRAGVNAFAAQVILSELKQQGDRVSQSGDVGLMEFIKMAPQERVERFGHLLGGRKLLDRVGVQIDMEW
ncbi:MAG: hypothetical protein M1839_002496 [Geoglossum umbratile]|nr:MAG: hypothetical protein M1839_002496 [Geoglossum umbratile]